MSLEQFERRCGAHLAGDDALEVLLHWQFVDGQHLVGLNQQSEGSGEGLRLMALPVEARTNGDVVQRERGIAGQRGEAQLAVLLAPPQQAAFGQLYGLRAFDALALSLVETVQLEVDALCTDDAHRHRGHLALDFRLVLRHWREPFDDGGKPFVADGALAQDGFCLRGGELLIVFLAWGDEQSRHVEGTGADE